MSGDNQAGWLLISTADQSNVLAALQGADTIEKYFLSLNIIT